ncbi:MAG: HEPN domain-containing protein [Candidatus Binatia bacterium]|jgi:HEPN domain-containing protein
MPPNDRDPTSPHEWVRRARSNLARARAGRNVPDVLYEDLCFDAQQAAEKAIKALLVHRQVRFPKTHDLLDLLTLLNQEGFAIPAEIREADALTHYAVETRYPGLAEEVTADEHTRAVELAERVLRWVVAQLPPAVPEKNSA